MNSFWFRPSAVQQPADRPPPTDFWLLAAAVNSSAGAEH